MKKLNKIQDNVQQKKNVLDTSENDCIKASKELINTKTQIQNILKLTETIKTETKKMIETENHT